MAGGRTNTANTVLSRATALAPGLACAAAAVAVGFAVHARFDAVSALTASLVIGVVAGNLGLVPAVADEGMRFASRQVLRAGIVLLGLQLSLGDLGDLGVSGLVAVVVAVAVTFLGTRALAAALGVSPGLGLLAATGYSICGVSAVSAMVGAVDGDKDDAAYAIALVTMFGSLSIVVLPFVGHVFGMGDVRFGAWAGSAVHDVAQVVATATANSPDSLASAVIVKLTRVAMLAPLVAFMAVRHRRRTPASGDAGPRTALLPLFIVGFLAMVTVRSTGQVPDGVLATAKNLERILLATALVGLGAGVKISRLRVAGARPLMLGLASWALVMGTSAVTIRFIDLGTP